MTLHAQAAPDGYTLYGGGSQVVTAIPLKKVSFDTRVVLQPVVQITSSWYFLLVHPSLPVKSVRELVALAKKRPGTLNYAPPGLTPAIRGALNRDIGQIIASPDLRGRITADGAEPAPPHSAAEIRDQFAREIEMWEKFIRTSGIKVE